VLRLPLSITAKRLTVFGLYGLVITGPILHVWYGLLEQLVAKLTSAPNYKLVYKLLIDRVLFGPPFVLFTIAFLQYLQTFSAQHTAQYIKRYYVAVLIMNQKVWTVAQAINFAVIPVQLQVLFVNAVAIGWNTYLSLAS
jgi:Mpv17 / PMP22 family